MWNQQQTCLGAIFKCSEYGMINTINTKIYRGGLGLPSRKNKIPALVMGALCRDICQVTSANCTDPSHSVVCHLCAVLWLVWIWPRWYLAQTRLLSRSSSRYNREFRESGELWISLYWLLYSQKNQTYLMRLLRFHRSNAKLLHVLRAECGRSHSLRDGWSCRCREVASPDCGGLISLKLTRAVSSYPLMICLPSLWFGCGVQVRGEGVVVKCCCIGLREVE